MIEILRLKTGEDIIGEVYSGIVDDEYEIHEPMSVGIEHNGKQSGIVMHHWLPVQLIEKNYTNIKKHDVLTKFTPNADFSEYYSNTVKKIQELMEAKKILDDTSEEEIQEAMDLLAVNSGNMLLH